MDMLTNIIAQFMILIKNLLDMFGVDSSKVDEMLGQLLPKEEEGEDTEGEVIA